MKAVWGVIGLIALAVSGVVYRGHQISEAEKSAELAELQQKASLRAAEEVRSQRWRYSERPDQMSGKEVKRAYVSSRNLVEFGAPYEGKQRATLELRIHPRYGRDVMLLVDRGQLMCGVTGCSVTVKFGDGKPQRFAGSPAKDGASTVVFIEGFDRFLSSLKQVRTVALEANVYKEGAVSFEFDVQEIDFP